MTKTYYRWLTAALIVLVGLLGWGIYVAMSPAPDHPAASPKATDASVQTAPAPQPAAQFQDQTTEHQRLAIEAATAMTTWSPAEDTSRGDAILRAEQYFTPEFTANFKPAPRASGSEWERAAEIRATSIPEVALVNTHQEPYVVEVTVNWLWQTPDGSTHAGDPSVQPRFLTFVFNEANRIVGYY